MQKEKKMNELEDTGRETFQTEAQRDKKTKNKWPELQGLGGQYQKEGRSKEKMALKFPNWKNSVYKPTDQDIQMNPKQKNIYTKNHT